MVQSRSNRQLYTAPASSLTVKSELYCVYVFGSDAWEYDICGNTRYVRGTASRDEHVHQTCDMPDQSPRAITTSYSSGDNIATRTSVSRRASDSDLAEEYCAGSHRWVSSKPSMDMRLKGCMLGVLRQPDAWVEHDVLRSGYYGLLGLYVHMTNRQPCLCANIV